MSTSYLIYAIWAAKIEGVAHSPVRVHRTRDVFSLVDDTVCQANSIVIFAESWGLFGKQGCGKSGSIQMRPTFAFHFIDMKKPTKLSVTTAATHRQE